MFEEYYKKLRFSQKMGDRSLIECMKIIESNRKTVLSLMKDHNVFCHQGCNLCCHALTLLVNPIDSYVLFRVFSTVPYNELFPFYQKCIDNRRKAQEYIDSLPDYDNYNYPLEAYNKLGATTQTCPFVDGKNGCLIHEFRPQICFSYFSSVPCKLSSNPDMNEEQRKKYNAEKQKKENIIAMGLDNDSINFSFDESTLKDYTSFNNLEKTIKQDLELEWFLTHNVFLEILTIMSGALKKSAPDKFDNDTKELTVYLLADIDGERKMYNSFL